MMSPVGILRRIIAFLNIHQIAGMSADRVAGYWPLNLV